MNFGGLVISRRGVLYQMVSIVAGLHFLLISINQLMIFIAVESIIARAEYKKQHTAEQI